MNPAKARDYRSRRRPSTRWQPTLQVARSRPSRATIARFSSSPSGAPVCSTADFHSTFRKASAAGLSAGPARCRPRMHDLRHAFAVRTLLETGIATGWTCRRSCRAFAPTSGTSDQVHVLVLVGRAGAAGPGGRASRDRSRGWAMSALAPTCRHSSPTGLWTSARPARTPSPPIATRSGCCSSSPSAQRQAPSELDSPTSTPHAQRRVPRPPRDDRDNSPRTRNARLAAIHSLFRYAALRHPEHAATIQRARDPA